MFAKPRNQDSRDVRPDAVPCLECGYDLRATSEEGRCPECGALAALSFTGTRRRSRIGRLLRSRLLLVSLGVICAGVVIGRAYVQVTEAWICPHCTRVQCRRIHTFEIPLSDAMAIRIPGYVWMAEPENPLVSVLDPPNRCSHEWRYFSERTVSWRGRIGGNPKLAIPPAIVVEADFEDFVRDNPRVVAELRSKIIESFQEGYPVMTQWLHDQYYDWKDRERQKRSDDGFQQPGG